MIDGKKLSVISLIPPPNLSTTHYNIVCIVCQEVIALFFKIPKNTLKPPHTPPLKIRILSNHVIIAIIM